MTFTITPTCVALLTILQQHPDLQDRYPEDLRRNCSIQAEVAELLVQREEDGDPVAWCSTWPRSVQDRATVIVDEIISLKKAAKP